MSTFKNVFPKKHTFLAVVHCENLTQTLRNAHLAKRAGADGIFLINHSIGYKELFDYYRITKEQLPDFWIGLNCLELGRNAINYIPDDLAGLWVDNAGIEEMGLNPTSAAESFDKLRKKSRWSGLYFGGVAFKYQNHVNDVARAAALAIPFVDVVTTSGPGTGQAAEVTKIRTMKEAIGNHPLAIASGITPENIKNFMPYIDCFLVATGISDSHAELNYDRVKQLAQILK